MKKSLNAAVALCALIVASVAWAGPVNTKDCTLQTKAQCNGTDGNDDFEGEDVDDGNQGAKDFIDGGEGRDGGNGNGGADRMLGGPGVDGAIDDFEGDEGNDYVSGGPGDDDEIEGGEGNDTVLGGPGDDFEVFGSSGDDIVKAGDGDDGDGGQGLLSGSSGENVVRGGDGQDFIYADSSLAGEKEKIFGGANKDEIKADDGVKDVIDCGEGNDSVTFDAGTDKLKNCEDKDPVN